IIECDHGKLKRIINATLGFKSMKTAYATIKGIEVMRALRKGQGRKPLRKRSANHLCASRF
ncbi:DDE domain-containing protein, partial [Candidatus Erwinia dacicola]|nr:DDE domain-containing protein [Candidatus Erwinia dacicola]